MNVTATQAANTRIQDAANLFGDTGGVRGSMRAFSPQEVQALGRLISHEMGQLPTDADRIKLLDAIQSSNSRIATGLRGLLDPSSGKGSTPEARRLNTYLTNLREQLGAGAAPTEARGAPPIYQLPNNTQTIKQAAARVDEIDKAYAGSQSSNRFAYERLAPPAPQGVQTRRT